MTKASVAYARALTSKAAQSDKDLLLCSDIFYSITVNKYNLKGKGYILTGSNTVKIVLPAL